MAITTPWKVNGKFLQRGRSKVSQVKIFKGNYEVEGRGEERVSNQKPSMKKVWIFYETTIYKLYNFRGKEKMVLCPTTILQVMSSSLRMANQ